jgi:hypothetical protein
VSGQNLAHQDAKNGGPTAGEKAVADDRGGNRAWGKSGDDDQPWSVGYELLNERINLGQMEEIL